MAVGHDLNLPRLTPGLPTLSAGSPLGFASDPGSWELQGCGGWGVAPFFWDNGEEYDRVKLAWRTPGLLEALRRATSGEPSVITKQ